MKRECVLARWMALIWILCGVMGVLSSCQATTPSNAPAENEGESEDEAVMVEPWKELVIGNERLVSYGDILFYASDHGLMCYDTVNTSYWSACTNAACGGCLLDSSDICFAGQRRHRLFLTAWEPNTGQYTFACYDISNGQLQVFDSYSEKDVMIEETPYWDDDGDAFYFVVQKQADGETLRTVCRVTDGGVFETLWNLRDGEHLIGTYQGYLITWRDGSVLATPLSEGESYAWRIGIGFSWLCSSIIGRAYLRDGKVYYLTEAWDVEVSRYTNRQYAKYDVFCMDLEMMLALEDPLMDDEGDVCIASGVSAFCLVGERLYEIPASLSYLHIPSDYLLHPENVVELNRCAEVWMYEHMDKTEGISAQSFCARADVEVVGEFTVLGERLYGTFRRFDTQALTWGELFFGCLDPVTDEVSVIESLQTEQEVD